MNEKFIIDILGWLAMILILSAYSLNSSNKVASSSILYQGLNFIGAALFIINLSYFAAWPSVMLNIIWALIALVSLLKGSKRK